MNKYCFQGIVYSVYPQDSNILYLLQIDNKAHICACMYKHIKGKRERRNKREEERGERVLVRQTERGWERGVIIQI